MQLSRLIQDRFARVAGRHDLTPVQARLLCVLAAGGPITMAELARCLGVEKAGLTGLVDRAERNDLVARSAVPGDRRALLVSLTQTGAGAAAAFHAEVTVELEQLLLPLGSRDRQRFQSALQTINNAAEQVQA